MATGSSEAEEEAALYRGCLSCLFGGRSSKTGSNNNQQSNSHPRDSTAANGRTNGKRQLRASVYVSARDHLKDDELKALKEFENKCMASFPEESLYFDALETVQETEDHDSTTSIPYMPATRSNPLARASVTLDDPSTLIKALKEPKIKADLKGYPGALTEQEMEACLKFRNELRKRARDTENDGKVYQEMVRVFAPIEEEPYALCRFLRSRKFNVDEVFIMMEEGVDGWREARRHNFFLDPSEALGGAPIDVLLTQYPAIYYGSAKNGAPVTYFRAGEIRVEGLECIIEIDRMTDFAWHRLCYEFKKQLAKSQETNPDVMRCEIVQVIDLKGLSASSLNSQVMEVMKKMAVVNRCFPEVLNAMAVLNAPRFFSFFWRVIKSMLEPRTVGKIKIFSNEHDGLKWLKEHIDESSLPSDYGGKGKSFSDALREEREGGSTTTRQIVKLLSISKSKTSTIDFELSVDEQVNVTVYTRSRTGGNFALHKDGVEVTAKEVKPYKEDPKPYSICVASDVKGPGKFQIKPAPSSSNLEYFLVAVDVK